MMSKSIALLMGLVPAALAGQHPARTRKMARQWDRWAAEVGVEEWPLSR